MTRAVVTVSPDHSVWHTAQIMLEERISGLPVMTGEGALIGIVTEGDLLRRTELGTAQLFSHSVEDLETQARPYIKSRSWKVGDVMTADPVTIEEHDTVQEVVALIARNNIKRLPVLKDGHLAGIVSRADLLKVVAAGKPDAQIRGDEAVRRAIVARLEEAAPVLSRQPQVAVEGGRITVIGPIRSHAEREAIRMIVEAVAGPGFEDRLDMSEDPAY